MKSQSGKALAIIGVLAFASVVLWLVVADLTKESPAERGARQGRESFEAAMQCAESGGRTLTIDGKSVCVR